MSASLPLLLLRAMVALALLAPVARADGVDALFAEANEKFANNDFLRAIALYERVLVMRPDPAVRFNLAVALSELGRWREAYAHLTAVLAGTGLGAREPEARAHLAEARAHLAILVLRVAPDVTVEVDGDRVTTSELVLDPGTHAVVARRAGYEPFTRSVALEAGRSLELPIALQRSTAQVRYVRRWSAVGPWLVFGIGTGAAIGGGITYGLARRELAEIDAQLAAECRTGCPVPPPALSRRADRQRRWQLAGASGMIGGGVVALVGGFLLYLNRERAEAYQMVVTTEASGTFVGIAGRY